MTRDETKKIIMAIVALYPNWDPAKNGGTVSATITAWHTVLGDYPYGAVAGALKAYSRTNNSGFAPSPGELIEIADRIAYNDDLSEMEAWSMVSRAIRNGIYGAEEEYKRLPEIVQKAVGGPSMLRVWAESTRSEIETVVQSNFMRTFRAVKERQVTDRKIPADVRSLVAKTMAQMIGTDGCRGIVQAEGKAAERSLTDSEED